MTTKEKFIEMAKNITRPGTEGERGRRQSRFSFLPAYHGTWYPPHAGGVRRCEQPHGRHEFC